jgi:hypothetical protein
LRHQRLLRRSVAAVVAKLLSRRRCIKEAKRKVAALGNQWTIKVSLVHAMGVKLLRDRPVCATSIDFGLMSQNLLRREAVQICRGSGGSSAETSPTHRDDRPPGARAFRSTEPV